MEQLTFIEEVQRISISLNKKVMTEIKERLLSQGITPFQYHILLIIGKCSHIGVTKLAEEMRVKPSAITPVINRLIDLELVSRYHSQEDRRKVNIELTAKGEQVIEEANEIVQKMIAHFFSCYEPKDQEQFLKLFKKLDANI
jgi:DNA-binding MarR family transcriptional regulator